MTREPKKTDAVKAPANSSGALRAERVQRASQIRAASDNRAVFSADDKERVASNLHRLINEVCADRGISKREIAQAARLGGNHLTDSTKRLDTYTLPRGANDARRSRLAKKPGKYLEIAEKISALLNDHSAPYICQVFEGCAFGADAEATPWVEARWAELSDRLRRMGAAVARDERTETYWAEAIRANGQFDHLCDQLLPAARCLDALGCSVGLADCDSHPTEVPPVPSVLLGKRPLMERRPASLRKITGEEVEVSACIIFEIRFALAPAGERRAPCPLLEFRSRVDLEGKGYEGTWFCSSYFDQTEGGLEVCLNGGAGSGRAIVHLEDDALPEAAYRDNGMHDCHAWQAVTPQLLQELLDDWGAPVDMANADVQQSAGALTGCKFEGGSAGFHLSARLLSGDLEAELAKACRNRTKLLHELRARAAILIADAETGADNRWRT